MSPFASLNELRYLYSLVNCAGRLLAVGDEAIEEYDGAARKWRVLRTTPRAMLDGSAVFCLHYFEPACPHVSPPTG